MLVDNIQLNSKVFVVTVFNATVINSIYMFYANAVFTCMSSKRAANICLNIIRPAGLVLEMSTVSISLHIIYLSRGKVICA